VPFPEPLAAPAGADAVGWLAGLLEREAEGGLHLLCLGPLTNLARLLAQAPGAARRLGGVIAMGGAVDERGNVGPRAEFNLAVDPEAAAAVLAAGLPLTLVPLDVTRRVRAGRAEVARLAAAPAPAARIAAALIDAYGQTTGGGESRPLHDPCVMLLAEAPELFDCRTIPMTVEAGTGPDAGGLLRDAAGAPVRVAMGVDGPAALALLAARLTAAA
jgi:purine nucleosidase/pyrimidine-specific ribonucleoside hydrolase